jgi:manganese/iron transport system permease protein
MTEILDTLYTFTHETWAIRALIASSLVGITCGVLGCFIVLRNMALIGDALAHAILPGVVVAFLIFGYSALGFFTGAAIAGLISAMGITWIQNNVKTKNDAAIGIVFTAMFSLGVMGISRISREGVHLDLQHFLFGQILGISDEDLYLTAFVTLYVLISIAVFYRYFFVTTFQSVIAETMGISVTAVHYFLMLLLSFAVVSSLQTVGVILVVAMLITPASTALLLSDQLNKVLVIAGFVGFISAVLGMFLANIFETTPGPAMAVTATFIYLLTVFFAPKKGLLFKFFRKRKLQSKIEIEDTLKQALKLHEKGTLTFTTLFNLLGFKSSRLKNHLKNLNTKGLMNYNRDTLSLTSTGTDKAKQMVRAHRLWETYLVQQIGLTEEQIHEDAEKYEHLLTDELLDEVDETLGFPSTDPHGSPIPAKKGQPDYPLFLLALNHSARISQKQIDNQVSSELWRLGLLPGTTFTVQKKNKETIEIIAGERTIQIPKGIAKRISTEEVS